MFASHESYQLNVVPRDWFSPSKSTVRYGAAFWEQKIIFISKKAFTRKNKHTILCLNSKKKKHVVHIKYSSWHLVHRYYLVSGVFVQKLIPFFYRLKMLLNNVTLYKFACNIKLTLWGLLSESYITLYILSYSVTVEITSTEVILVKVHEMFNRWFTSLWYNVIPQKN